jgi:hypothetical protein
MTPPVAVPVGCQLLRTCLAVRHEMRPIARQVLVTPAPKKNAPQSGAFEGMRPFFYLPNEYLPIR